MNSTIDLQLEHKTIRKFKDEAISDELIQKLFDVANRTATGMGLQHFSIIRITDAGIKKGIAEISGQAYIFDMPEVWVFLADLNRNYHIAVEGGADGYINSMYALNIAYADAFFAAQNVNLAVESLGMGAVYLGSPLRNIEEFIDLLKLPEYTMPAICLGFGYPAETPKLKPRMDGKFKFFENTYPDMGGIREKLKDHDEEMSKYIDLRNPGTPLAPFTKQVVGAASNLKAKMPKIAAAARKQGFNLDV